MKKVAIIQSNYIPWKGYFDIINTCDEFIIYDSVQFTKNDWRNRNRIVTSSGVRWLSIPVKHHFGQTISETKVASHDWSGRHWSIIVENYRKSKFFSKYSREFEAVYFNCRSEYLSDINRALIVAVCNILGIRTRISRCTDYKFVATGRTQRLVDLCVQANAGCYVTGPSALSYLSTDLFFNAGIDVEVYDYEKYFEYSQMQAIFDHNVSIIDLLFNEGENAQRYMKSFGLSR